ncbi:hypothetical protein HNO88_002332 [Novosphingobium chloroacetimidivorans]|uniref:Uncharacterized protein n=1 Tax=Novosphingobium chloroacetimidivorans TaxID=1428314 RepID=A0A7W7KAN5_9SPHN|nr:hypothetical protein [Novosphingobium chloroacetimidivorans]
MLTSACAFLFALGAFAALAAIAATLHDFAPDVAALRVRRLTGERPLLVTWRILSTPAIGSPVVALRASGPGRKAAGHADLHAKPGSLRHAA